MKKAGIYSPYWDTLGGGEYYTAQFAKSLLASGYQVEIFTQEKEIIHKVQQRFEIDISSCLINQSGYKAIRGSILQKLLLTKKYDVIFYMSDGSVPFLFSKNNILHFQVPFKNVGGKKLLTQLKIRQMDHIVCNSKFTKQVIDNEFDVDSQVIYPPVKSAHQLGEKKENYILSVGRFDNLMQSKRQDILIEVFKSMKLENWKLVLAGGVLHGEKYVEELRLAAHGAAIEILPNITHEKLQGLYTKAKIFWHAAGFGLDVQEHPQKAEHFGISIIEALSAGAFPIAFNAGGPREVLKNSKVGSLWNTKDELVSLTREAMKNTNLHNTRSEGIEFSKQFNLEKFNAEVKKIIS